MIERDLARLRVLSTRVMKGEVLDSEDLNYVQKKQVELSAVLAGIDEMIECCRIREEQR